MINSLLVAFLNLFLTILFLYKWAIIIHAMLSWVQPDPYNPIVQTLNRIVQPSYNLVRRIIPTVFGGLDIAPMILIFGIIFLETFFRSLFMSF